VLNAIEPSLLVESDEESLANKQMDSRSYHRNNKTDSHGKVIRYSTASFIAFTQTPREEPVKSRNVVVALGFITIVSFTKGNRLISKAHVQKGFHLLGFVDFNDKSINNRVNYGVL
jgi:hypothetical protein